MMRVTLIKLSMLLASLSLFSACGEKKPADAVTRFYENIATGKTSEAMTQLDSDFIAVFGDYDSAKSVVVDPMNKDFQQHKGIDKITVLQQNQTADRADVTFQIVFKDSSQRQEKALLVKRQDQWKITLNKPALDKPVPGLTPPPSPAGTANSSTSEKKEETNKSNTPDSAENKQASENKGNADKDDKAISDKQPTKPATKPLTDPAVKEKP